MKQIFAGIGLRATGSNVRFHNVFEIAAALAGDLADDVPIFETDVRLSTMKDFGAVGAGVMDAVEFDHRTKTGLSADVALKAFETWISSIKSRFHAEEVVLVFNNAADQLFLRDMYAARRMEPGFDRAVDLSSYYMGVVGTLPDFAEHAHIANHLGVSDIPFATALHQATFAADAFHSLLEWRTTRYSVTQDPATMQKASRPEIAVAPVETPVAEAKPVWRGSRGKNPTRIGMPAVAVPAAIAPTVLSQPSIPAALRPTMVTPRVESASEAATPTEQPKVAAAAEARVSWPSTDATHKRMRSATPGEGSYRSSSSSVDCIPVPVAATTPRQPKRNRGGVIIAEDCGRHSSSDPRCDGAISTYPSPIK